MHTDEHIEYWGKVFVDNQLRQTGLTFERFIEDPVEHLEAELFRFRERSFEPDPLPLLPRQRAVQARIDAQLIDEQLNQDLDHRAVLRDQVLIEPLRHHAMSWKR